MNSGEVIYQDNLTARPGSYEYISGYCAAGILEHFNIKVAESTERKVEEKREEKEEAVVAFSGGAGRLRPERAVRGQRGAENGSKN